MFKEGDYIVYRSTGVCRVDAIGTPTDFPAATEGVVYYQLTPVRGAGSIYIPVDSPVFMRPVITREEAMELIASIPSIEKNPNYSKDQKALNEYYKSLLQTHDCAVLVQLIKNIQEKTRVLNERGKTAGKTDTQYRKQAEELLREELSVALEIPLDQVFDYVNQQLQQVAI
jgi:CarD family transcriptional regulator